ncbi:lipopolysaccharide biosynthesis protein [Demequina capsici]|uniref:Polysaccharide biosynthesis C-terminal domain-containing protein n=1 Tax=Demequina capsici TaxID=3075620 RepID=A0AA96J861_9MICO|nr:polysaccharide biosynthesis C-terminal domain-containing protein [Demequina sp. OYTSA14]WNM24733.1 polysaccharide biosynthesis C-terminal domain-containing protein [Demequina sp. OYTSA14]
MHAPLWHRLVGFSLIPALAAISPLVVLPVVARTAGAAGWSSAIAGESVGTFAAIALAFGWTTVGPAHVAHAPVEMRARLYRESLVVRGLMAVPVIPALVVICLAIATPGYELLTVVMGLQGALIAMSFSWFAVGVADPGAIARLDAIPRVLGALAAAGLIAATGALIVYPLIGIAVTAGGTAAYSRKVLRDAPGPWPTRAELPALLRSTAAVAVNDAALGAYSSVPSPLVNVSTPAAEASAYASADKMIKLGQFIPITLGNALQAWTAEAHGAARATRVRRAIGAHAVLGLVGWVAVASLGPWASRVLFGGDAAADRTVLVILGAAFAAYSVRTSVTRHLLFPCGRTRIVVVATLLGSAIGVPAMLILTPSIGSVGAAIGYAVTELISTVVPWRQARVALRDIAMQRAPEADPDEPPLLA